jgi:FkbM family methyltransferase
MPALLDMARTFVKIRRLNTPAEIKARIRRSYLNVFALNKYDHKTNIANIAGYNVSFLDFRTFSQLFRELFINNDYYFSPDSDAPYIIDCGSNIGMSILYFKMLYPKCKIVAFEPGVETFSCLEKNVRDNRLTFVDVHNAALSNTEGTLDFYYDPDNVGSLKMSLRQERMAKQTRSVHATRLSPFIDQEVDFLKMDIEGAELDVIEELYKAGKLSHIKQLIIEYHHHLTTDSDVLSTMLKILEDAGLGYQIESYLPRPLQREQFQDVLIYAYRKSPIDRHSAVVSASSLAKTPVSKP